MKRNISLETIGIITITLLGTFLRFFHLSKQSYWMDEGYTINAVLSINEKGKAILDSGQSYFCPLYCYPTAWLTHLFGLGAFTYRLLAAITGSLFILVFWYTAKNIEGRKVALLATFFISLSYWQVAWSHQARWYTLFALLFWLATYFLYQAISKSPFSKTNLLLGIFFLILSTLVQPIGILLLPITLIWLIPKTAPLKNKFKDITFFTILAVTIPLILELAFPKIATFFLAIIKNIKPHYTLPYYLSFYLRNYWVFIIFYIVALTINKKDAFLRYSVFIILGYLFAFSFFTDIVHYRYLFHVTSLLYLGGAVGIVDIAKSISKPLYQYVFLALIILIFFGTKNGTLLPQKFYLLESDNPEKLNRPYYAYTPQPDFNSAYAFIQQNRKPGDIIISSHPQFNKIFLNEPGYWIEYNYLGLTSETNSLINNKEYYVGAETIHNTEQLAKIVSNHHGFIVYDYMTANGRIPANIQNYIKMDTTPVFENKINSYSMIWVYQF